MISKLFYYVGADDNAAECIDILDKAFLGEVEFVHGNCNELCDVLLNSESPFEDEAFATYIKTAYDNKKALFLLAPTEKNIQAISVILDMNAEQLNCSNNTEESYLAVLCIEKGPDGLTPHVHRHYEAYQCIDIIAEALYTIISQKSKLTNSDFLVLKEDAEKGLQNAGVTIDLVNLAKSFLKTESYSPYGKYMQVTFFVVSCHEFTGESMGDDWYYFRQIFLLNGEKYYRKTWETQYYYARHDKEDRGRYWVGSGDVCEKYIDFYEMDNYFTNDSTNEINIIASSPQAVNKETIVTTTVSTSVSGSAGISYSSKNGLEGSGSIGIGGIFTDSKAFSISDCTVQNNSTKQNKSSAGWKYTFKRAERDWRFLINPALLSYSTFTPVHMWIWKMPSKDREKFKNFQSMLRCGMIATATCNSGSLDPHQILFKPQEQIFTINLTAFQPPLFGSDLDKLSFGKDGGTKNLFIQSQYKWKMEIDYADKNVADWCKVDTSSGEAAQKVELVIGVKNYSGSLDNRKCTLIFKSVDPKNGGMLGRVEISQINC